MFNFEKLETWQKAIEVADSIYKVAKSFPEDERFGLTSQMRRAAVSISSKIDEGCSRHSRDDYARFLEIATGSGFEVVSQAFVGRMQGPRTIFIPSICWRRNKSRMLSGLRRSLSVS